MPELPKTYTPSEIESDIYRAWEASGFFNPDKLPGAKKKTFTISMPPPNITGELHVGHALGMTIQDVLIRYHRLLGEKALWVPGTDHAAIATQVVVERELRKEGFDRASLGRKKFLDRVWKWKELYGGKIVEQVKAMGASADWSRERFTMDEGLTQAVQTAFVKLYKDGLIYRGERIINWCSDCQTAISDLEVDHQDVPGKLWYIRYPLVDGSGTLTVATTRPETMLGDTAVAVNPKDERYAKMVGKNIRLPIADREIPIIADNRIDQTFGTGAVKVTPAHDPLDFDLGRDHKLPSIQIIGFDGKMTAEAGKDFSGLTPLKAREKVVDLLRESNILEKEEDYIHAVGFCSRTKTIIEPLVSLQWFMSMKPMAAKAMAAVRTKKITIVPERYEKVYFHWMENIRDWNISRQIWWGHRLPVWYAPTDVKHEQPKVSVEAPAAGWVQDDNTLDTWFSSGLWTFSTLGWPKKTKDLQRFHPTDVMETGWDILFFWVARMIMFSLYFTGEIPFKTVYLHGLILDEQGKKMSKSKGTGIDPLPIAEKYGMDALRMSLIIGNAPGQDFRLYEKKIEGYRNFANKLWNVARFTFLQPRPEGKVKPVSLADQWIDQRRKLLINTVTEALERLDLSAAGQALYDFVWHDFADWYIESSKVEPNIGLTYDVLETVLVLLHPFMPFITEHLWAQIRPGKMLMVASWPKKQAQRASPAVKKFEALQQTVSALRNFKLHSQMPTTAPVRFVNSLSVEPQLLKTLSGVATEPLDRLTVTGGYHEIVLGEMRFHIPSEYVQKFESWRTKERQELEKYIATIEQKLANQQFVDHAPAAVVADEREKIAEAKRRLLEV